MTPDQLLRLYDVAQREYHFVVQLGSQRQALYIILNAAILGGLAGSGRTGLLPALAYLGGAMASAFGAAIVRQSHNYYRAARGQLQAVEKDLALGPLALMTTPGMAGDTGKRRLRIVTAASIVLYLFAALDLVSAAASLGAL
jgi:hypothetical protein